MNNKAACETIILCAGGINYTDLPINTSFSNAMIPINGKPVISWILDDLLKKNIKTAVIVLNEEDHRLSSFLQRAYSMRMTIIQTTVPSGGNILKSLQVGLEAISNLNHVRLLLGDTLIYDNFDADFDFVYIASVEDSHRWCLALVQDGFIQDYVDKQDYDSIEKYALAGYYYFLDGKYLLSSVLESVRDNKHELSVVLKRYGQAYPIRAVPVKEWNDFGHIDNLLAARRRLLQSRFFNSLTINPVLNTITKVSIHDQKLDDELNWYLALPDELKVLTPRILHYERVDGRLNIVQEYYGYPTLAELYVYGELSADRWASILRQIIFVHREFNRYPGELLSEEIYGMYMGKTRERLELLKENDDEWNLRLSRENVVYNDKILKNVWELMPMLEQPIRKIADSAKVCIIHGDFCFSNILFDINNQIIRLIDPRGNFGRKGVYGDPRYDIAKLSHSVYGRYDFIMADMFTIEEITPGVLVGQIFSNHIQEQVAHYFDHLLIQQGFIVEEIRLIEGLLFISMLPFHSDHPQRQKMLYATGLSILNEVLSCEL